jgi:uncharacterized zinc-type alcohol dehydrogenase-like protein
VSAVAWLAHGPVRPPERVELAFGPLGEREVEIEIECCGVCHSDLHILRNDWGFTQYPVVAGHEIVGRVAARGSAVIGVKEGDRVGVGWQRGACLTCEVCLAGEEQLCQESDATALGASGGFATRVRADSRFVHAIPDGMSSATAAPLLCAGATVFSPLVIYGVRATMRVGVIGIGGLGHLALQFARAWGCEVTAFSSSPDKEQEAKRFGAHHFVCTSDPGAVRAARRTIDFMLSTVNASMDVVPMLQMMRPNGTYCVVGAPEEPLRIPSAMLLDRQLRICGSLIAPRHRMREMLAFAARHSIKPLVEVRPMSEVASALERLARNEARYRIVLVPSQL